MTAKTGKAGHKPLKTTATVDGDKAPVNTSVVASLTVGSSAAGDQSQIDATGSTVDPSIGRGERLLEKIRLEKSRVAAASIAQEQPAVIGPVVSPVTVTAPPVKTKTERVGDLMKDMKAKCRSNGAEIGVALKQRDDAVATLKSNLPSTKTAIASIMAMAAEMATWPAEEKKRYIEQFKVLSKSGTERKLIFGKIAQEENGVCIPLAQVGYNGLSAGHTSKVGAVSKYCLSKGVLPDGVSKFIDDNGGFVKVYDLSRAKADQDGGDDQAAVAKERARKVAFLQEKAAIGGALTTDLIAGSSDGLHCVICVRKPDGNIYPVAPVKDGDGTLYATLLSRIDDQKCGAVDHDVSDEQLQDSVASVAKLAVVTS